MILQLKFNFQAFKLGYFQNFAVRAPYKCRGSSNPTALDLKNHRPKWPRLSSGLGLPTGKSDSPVTRQRHVVIIIIIK